MMGPEACWTRGCDVARWQAILRKAPMLLKEEVSVLQKRATLLREVRSESNRAGGVDVC